MSYQNALREADIERSNNGRESLTTDLFEIVRDLSQKLDTLLPEKNRANVNLRKKSMFKDSKFNCVRQTDFGNAFY